MIIENGKVRAATMVNRVLDITMEGTYGYMPKAQRDMGMVLLTAQSTVREFAITEMQEVDLPHHGKTHCLIGTDYYGREMQLPVNRVKGFTECDTSEQGHLKGLNWLIQTFVENRNPALSPAESAAVDAFFKEIEDKRAALISAGVVEYDPMRASEEEL
jgi:hypothetical protein